MAYIHKITATQARDELTEAVKVTQGSKKTASWKPSARPCWWIDDHPVTLLDNSEVRTGIFDGTAKRKWKKSHYQAALFLYQQWRTGGNGKEESKEEPKAEDEIKEEPSLKPRSKRKEKKEEPVVEPSVPQRKPKRGKGKRQAVGKATDVSPPGAEENSREEEEAQRPLRTRAGKILRAKKEMVTPPKASPVPTRRTSSRRASSSSERTDGTPSPIIRRTRAKGRGKQVIASPKQHAPLREPPAKKPQRRTGKAVTRRVPTTQLRRESTPQSPGNHSSPPPSSPPYRPPSDASSHEEDGVTPGRLRDEETNSRNRRSPRLSANSTENSPSSTPPTTRKRSLSQVDDESTSRPLRGPLRELQDNSNMQQSLSKKRRRVTDLEEPSFGKENQAPLTGKSKSARLRSTHERKDKASTVEAHDIGTEAENNNDESQEHEVVYDSGRPEKNEKRVKFLREQMKRAKVERDHALKLIEDNFEEFEIEANIQKRQLVEKLRAAYRTRKLKFSRQILDMPIATFAEKHGGDVDEWMQHDTEEGVNKTFEALNKGEAPKIGMMGPPRTPTAMSRRAALVTTARKTRRKVAEGAPATGFTIRRSQRTAAKVATERTRAIVSCTPRTGRKEAPAPQHPQHPQPPQTPTGVSRGAPGQMPNFASICSRQQFAALAQSIQKQDNPVEAFRQFTAQLQRETFQ